MDNMETNTNQNAGETNELLILAKQTLGIISTATQKDSEIQMILDAGIKDLQRAGVAVDTENQLVRNALMTYVKANFGISNPTDKEKFMKAYRLFLSDLSLSEGYKQEEEQVNE